MEKREKKKFTVPHIYVLLFCVIIFCSILTWVLPAGEFDRVQNEAGREVVVAGSYHSVEPSPVGAFDTIKAVYNGMLNGSGVIFFVFLAYASIGLIISTGAFNGLIGKMLKNLRGKSRVIIIPIFILVLGISSSTIGIFEEAFPFIPIFVGISIAMGYDAVVGLAIVALGVGLGYAGAIMNPFTVGMANSIAGLPQLTGVSFRIISHLITIVIASIFTIRYALKIQDDPTKSYVYGDDFSHIAMKSEDLENHVFGIREKLVLIVFAIGIAVIVWGVKVHGWYFEDLSAVFMIMGVISALIKGDRLNDIGHKFSRSFKDVAMACMLIGFARGILVVLEQGHIIDTIIYGLSIPLNQMPKWFTGVAMLFVQTILNFIIPSGSGQAVTSMPIMAPLSDIIGLSRQVSVLAFQFGDGLSNIIWPTCMAPIMCGLAGVKIEKWWKFIVPLFIILFIAQAVLVTIAAYIW
ncbi:MAG: TIGR00366 family protein [Tissierellia bacterium]|nr:TIGR00366 family protein [Tissierellia bacterium]